MKLQYDTARAMPGVSAIVRLKDDGAKVRFVGDEVAAVAAATLLASVASLAGRPTRTATG